MKLIITFYITRFSLMKAHWNKNSLLKGKGILGTKKPIGKNVNLGGLIVKFDWSKKKEICSRKISCPSGFDFKNNQIYVASMRKNKVYVLDLNFNIVRIIKNKLFNDVHSLVSTKQGFLLTSSGLDLILELDERGNSLWAWWAPEQGYKMTPLNKKRIINKDKDYTKVDCPTLNQTTHVNSAIYEDNKETKILASLFHQGKVIEINKSSHSSRDLLKNLKQPHSIQHYKKNFMVADTNNNKIIFFNKEGIRLRTLKGNFNWIQDCTYLDNGNLLLVDSNNHRLVELDFTGKVVSSFNYSKEYKIYQVREIK